MMRIAQVSHALRVLLILFIWLVILPLMVEAQEGALPLDSTNANLIDNRRIGAATPLLDFEEFGYWSRGQETWGTFIQSSEEVIEGAFAGKFSYTFPTVPNNYIVFRQSAPIPGRPNGLQIQVYGNASTHFLNGWVQDATGQVWQFTFGRIEHTGWQTMFAPLDLSLGWPNQAIYTPNDGDVVFPIELAALVLDGHSSEQVSQGVVYVDDLRAITFADSPYFSNESRPDEDAERPLTVDDQTATVTIDRLNVRAGPATRFPVLTNVNEGDRLPIVAEDSVNGWLQVVTEAGLGWIVDDFVVVEFNAAAYVIDGPPITETVAITNTVTISPAVLSPSIPLSTTLVITASPPVDDSLPISPVGRIAFPSYAAGSYSIFVINADGTDLKWIVGNGSQPALNEDSTRIAFRNWEDDARGLAVVDVDGSSVRQITGTAEDALPAWAPDDDTLVFFSRRAGDRRARIYQASVQNRNEWELIEVGGEYPSWMADGRLLYRATRPQIALAVMDDDGANPIRLIADGQAAAPVISSNGHTILYMTRQDGNWEIYRTDIDGSEPVRLTEHRANDGLPTFSPDGQHVAFVTNRDGFWAIWLMDVDGANQRELLAIPGDLDPRLPDEPTYRFRGWQEERISWGP